MMTKSLMTGISAGLTVGALAFNLSRKTRKGKRKLKARASKALRTFGDLVDEMSDMLK